MTKGKKQMDGTKRCRIQFGLAAKLTRNEHTIQRYANYGVLSAKRGDLKRACTVRKRKSLANSCIYSVRRSVTTEKPDGTLGADRGA